MTPDVINAGFEGLGAVMVADNVRVLLRDRTVRGTSLLTVLFFTLWGAWNLYYYPSLGQTPSGACALLVTVTNAIYLLLALRFRRAERRAYWYWETY